MASNRSSTGARLRVLEKCTNGGAPASIPSDGSRKIGVVNVAGVTSSSGGRIGGD